MDELERRYRSAGEGTERSQWHLLWRLAPGHPAYQVAQMTGYGAYWIGRIARRFNEEGEAALVDQRKVAHWRPGPQPRPLVATPEPLEEVREEVRQALAGPAAQGDVWTSRTVAAGLSARSGRPVSQDAALHYRHLLDFTPPAPRPRPRGPGPAAPPHQSRRSRGASRL